MVRKLFWVISSVMRNPVNRGMRLSAFLRFIRWQVGSWLVPGEVLVPWVNGSRIIAGFMMSGSAGCAYSGLHEFEEMAFVLHFLRKADLFLDVGANVGVFTVLAGSAIGTHCIAVEPGDEAFGHLLDNIALNGMGDRVKSKKVCVSNEDSTCLFNASPESTLSHIAVSGDEGNTHSIECLRIDSILKGQCPVMVKIDVEGYERQALEGASAALGNKELKAVLLEIDSHSERYEVSPDEIHSIMIEYGFCSYTYDPFSRCLSPLESYSSGSNTLYLRDVNFVTDRVVSSSSYLVFGKEI